MNFEFGAVNPLERPDQHIVDLLGEEETGDERHRERDQRLDQARAQLDQVLEQRRLGGFDFLFFVFASHAERPPASAVPGAGATVSRSTVG